MDRHPLPSSNATSGSVLDEHEEEQHTGTVAVPAGPLAGTRERDQPSWSIAKSAATGTIVLRFVGPTRTWEIPEFFAALSEMLPADKAQIIFDLRELHGHNPEIRVPAKQWLQDNEARIGQLTIVVPRAAALYKVVVGLLSLATGVQMRVRDDLGGEALDPSAL